MPWWVEASPAPRKGDFDRSDPSGQVIPLETSEGPGGSISGPCPGISTRQRGDPWTPCIEVSIKISNQPRPPLIGRIREGFSRKRASDLGPMDGS